MQNVLFSLSKIGPVVGWMSAKEVLGTDERMKTPKITHTSGVNVVFECLLFSSVLLLPVFQVFCCVCFLSSTNWECVTEYKNYF